MPSGLVALLDDVSVLARAAAASVDDISVAASRAGTKTAGVVIDDAAVTPSYVNGISPARELPIIWKITKGSFFNKLVILLPAALLLSELLPWSIIFFLMLGGAYLSYEGAEKVMEKLGGTKHGETLEDEITDPAGFEKARVSGAIRTDLILSAEIMAITLSEVGAESLIVRAGVLALVGIAVTVVVYGAVAIIVKLDDIGLHLSQRDSDFAHRVGCLLLRAVPKLLIFLSVVGTIAMLWVGGGIILHGTHELGFDLFYDLAHGAEEWVRARAGGLAGLLGWATYAAFSALVGIVLGAVIAFILHDIIGYEPADH